MLLGVAQQLDLAGWTSATRAEPIRVALRSPIKTDALRVYEEELVGRAPRFPREIEDGISRYLAMLATPADLPESLSDPGEREDAVSRGGLAGSPRGPPGG